mmetsp:Transcript_8362/g.18260  ORF Transcript_8362/g.18260 Transcript_8362/m.18260 type:complete len:218 (-) Transcript_8362:616-1269(-)
MQSSHVFENLLGANRRTIFSTFGPSGNDGIVGDCIGFDGAQKTPSVQVHIFHVVQYCFGSLRCTRFPRSGPCINNCVKAMQRRADVGVPISTGLLHFQKKFFRSLCCSLLARFCPTIDYCVDASLIRFDVVIIFPFITAGFRQFFHAFQNTFRARSSSRLARFCPCVDDGGVTHGRGFHRIVAGFEQLLHPSQDAFGADGRARLPALGPGVHNGGVR